MTVPEISLYSQIKSGYVVVNRNSSAEHRFWYGINKHGPIHPVIKTRCWLWTKRKIKEGYGVFRYNHTRSQGLCHRFSWILHYGEIPEGLLVLHRCDVRNCCNPNHLFIGTQQDNVDDMEAKGRNPKHYGEKNGNSKLTEEAVRHIRNNSPKLSYRQLAKVHGVTIGLVGHIVRGLIWRHVK